MVPTWVSGGSRSTSAKEELKNFADLEEEQQQSRALGFTLITGFLAIADVTVVLTLSLGITRKG